MRRWVRGQLAGEKGLIDHLYLSRDFQHFSSPALLSSSFFLFLQWLPGKERLGRRRDEEKG